MKHIAAMALTAVLPACVFATELKSPGGSITLAADVIGGVPTYSVEFKGKKVIADSHLGLELINADNLLDGFEIAATSISDFDETWEPVWGEQSRIRNKYRELLMEMRQPATDRLLNVRFRVYDDGIGFRYEFPQQKGLYDFTIAEERSQFAMTGDHTAWWIAGDYDTQEYPYTCSRLSEIRQRHGDNVWSNASQSIFSETGVQTSLQMKTDDGVYLNIHEAALVDYPCMHLNYNEGSQTFVSWLTPDKSGVKGRIQVPFNTPWRAVIIGEKATDMLASNLILNLNEPCKIEDTSWIHPVKYMGVWWEMITGKSSWSYTRAENFDLATFDYSKAGPHGRHGANNENVRRYIDYAARHGFDQLLVEGWNIGWEDWFGKEKDFVFDFVTPYPDFDIAALSEYAHSKGIKLMMHHETSSSIGNYERHVDAAYDLMNKYGYDAVKSGYVGNILPDSLHHYSQRTIHHYLDMVRRAADKHIMVNGHEAVRPTGLCRTWPNLVGNESAMGQEFAEMPPNHVTILPFTRLQGGPMDFTPGIFRMDITSFAPGNQGKKKRATICNQLALYCTMYSPLQMAADLPEHYDEHPDAFQFIKDVAVDWSESHYLDAEPGEYIVVARKAKSDGNWFVGGVTNEEGRDYSLKFDFLEPSRKYEATLYTDSADADGFDNPERYEIRKLIVDGSSSVDIRMARAGGFAVSLRELSMY